MPSPRIRRLRKMARQATEKKVTAEPVKVAAEPVVEPVKVAAEPVVEPVKEAVKPVRRARRTTTRTKKDTE